MDAKKYAQRSRDGQSNGRPASRQSRGEKTEGRRGAGGQGKEKRETMRRDDATRTNAARAHRSSKHRSRAAPKSRDAPRLERSSDQPKHRDVVFRPDARDLKPVGKSLRNDTQRANGVVWKVVSPCLRAVNRQNCEPKRRPRDAAARDRREGFLDAIRRRRAAATAAVAGGGDGR